MPKLKKVVEKKIRVVASYGKAKLERAPKEKEVSRRWSFRSGGIVVKEA